MRPLLLTLWMTVPVFGQTPTTTDELIKELQSGTIRTDILHELGKRSGEPAAVEALENAFRSGDKLRRKQVALAISPAKRLDGWMYQEIESYAARAIRSGVPPMNHLDSGGRAIRGMLTPEFETWCQAQRPTVDCVALVQGTKQLRQ